jgi:hypothetical protein
MAEAAKAANENSAERMVNGEQGVASSGCACLKSVCEEECGFYSTTLQADYILKKLLSRRTERM